MYHLYEVLAKRSDEKTEQSFNAKTPLEAYKLAAQAEAYAQAAHFVLTGKWHDR